jgi:hypothetical protein
MGEGFESVSFPFRKPLIQKTEENRGTGSRVRTKLHRIRQGCLSISLIYREKGLE